MYSTVHSGRSSPLEADGYTNPGWDGMYTGGQQFDSAIIAWVKPWENGPGSA
jgi:hypothetical protein